MSPSEILLRVQKKAYQRSDSNFSKKFDLPLDATSAFPQLPQRASAPNELLDGLRINVEEILQGEWRAFGHLPLKVDDPPRWQRDYAVGKDFQSDVSAFRLDHRAQPGGADIKIIWEPSRWFQLVRLAMAAWLLDHHKAQEKCIEWLHDWNKTNQPFTGLNWTSGLEVGMRLVNFTWIDSLLTAAGAPAKTLQELREQILPPHIWYTWRYKSFGSSANNHLLGELAGLIIALTRWPELQKISAPLPEIARIFEREVLLQFAPDGGNNEQALGYHLFSWEFCWQCEKALEAASIPVSVKIKDRLAAAGAFYAAVKPEGDPWDFGDSDNAFVTPLFADEKTSAREWWRWFRNSDSSPALRFWWGNFPSHSVRMRNQWQMFENSGYAIFESEDWLIRLDLSPLGYLSLAPHGHLDALHVSIWHRGEPVIIDPGTGAYYADKTVRNYFADWSAHNSPHLKSAGESFPKRFGTFLWGAQHSVPKWNVKSPTEIAGELTLPYGSARRFVSYLPEENAIQIRDHFTHPGNRSPVLTRWKFSPSLTLAQTAPSLFHLASEKCSVHFQIGPEWKAIRSFNPPPEIRGRTAPTVSELGNVPLQALVSPAFRSLAAGSYLALEGSGEGPFEITILPG